MTHEERLHSEMLRLRGRFREQCPDRAASLREAAQAHDPQAIREIAHGLVGTAGLFGFGDVSDAARSVVEHCRSGKDSEVIAAAEALAALLDRTALEAE